MAPTTRTTVLSGLGIAIVASLAFVSFRTDPVPVDLADVTQGPLEITVNADGRTKIRDTYDIASPIAGTALRAPVDVGDVVVAHQTVVARVRPSSSALLDARTRLQSEAALQEAHAALNVAQADMHNAEETENFARTQLKRTQALVSSGVASITRLEDDTQRLSVAATAVEAAQARIEMAQGAIERARAALIEPDQDAQNLETCCIELTSPADGVVLSVGAISERPVAIGAPLVSIGEPSNLELVADILSTDAVRLSPGALAYVERWGGSGTLTATLDRIDPKARTETSALGIEEQRVDAYFTLTSPFEDRPGLGDSFAVFLRIVEWSSEDAVQLPLSAVFRDGDDWAVFVASEGFAQLRKIELGRRNGKMSHVLSGVTPSERVILHPSDRVSDGASIVERSEL